MELETFIVGVLCVYLAGVVTKDRASELVEHPLQSFAWPYTLVMTVVNAFRTPKP